MNWEDEHKRRVEAFPREIREAHAHCRNHRAEIMASSVCGCFCCCATFSPSEILDWVDEAADGEGQTPLCPKCGIDSVISDKSGIEISDRFLSSMNSHWF
jgi:hypothetical protein